MTGFTYSPANPEIPPIPVMMGLPPPAAPHTMPIKELETYLYIQDKKEDARCTEKILKAKHICTSIDAWMIVHQTEPEGLSVGERAVWRKTSEVLMDNLKLYKKLTRDIEKSIFVSILNRKQLYFNGVYLRKRLHNHRLENELLQKQVAEFIAAKRTATEKMVKRQGNNERELEHVRQKIKNATLKRKGRWNIKSYQQLVNVMEIVSNKIQ